MHYTPAPRDPKAAPVRINLLVGHPDPSDACDARGDGAG